MPEYPPATQSEAQAWNMCTGTSAGARATRTSTVGDDPSGRHIRGQRCLPFLLRLNWNGVSVGPKMPLRNDGYRHAQPRRIRGRKDPLYGTGAPSVSYRKIGRYACTGMPRPSALLSRNTVRRTRGGASQEQCYEHHGRSAVAEVAWTTPESPSSGSD